MNSVLVTGASRGIGLELVRQLAERSAVGPAEQVVFASCRNPASAARLQKLAASNPNVHLVELDVQNEETYHSAMECMERVVGDSGLNVLVNNAGINRGATVKYGSLTRRDMAEIYDVNIISPTRLTQALLPSIRRAAADSPIKTMSFQRAAVCNISSSLGSISRNKTAGFVVFRESKAALNMMTRSLSVELRKDNILVMSLCPGWVRTATGGPFAVQSPEEAVNRLLANMDAASEDSHGKLIGNTVPPTFYDF